MAKKDFDKALDDALATKPAPATVKILSQREGTIRFGAGQELKFDQVVDVDPATAEMLVKIGGGKVRILSA